MDLPFSINLDDLKGEEFQTRVALDDDTILDYAEVYREDPAKMPPVEVVRDTATDALLLTDGFHRVEAARRAGLREISCHVTEGTPVDALAAALRANAVHGLRRTNADKRRALEMAWEHQAELFGGVPSHEMLAAACGVSKRTAQRFRETAAGVDNVHPCERVGTDGKRYSAAESAAQPGVLFDKVGQEVPPRLIATFRSKAALQAINQMARGLRALELVRQNPNCYTEMAWIGNYEIGNIDLEIKHLRMERPYAVCPVCGGKGCSRCSGYGFLPKRKYEALAKEIEHYGIEDINTNSTNSTNTESSNNRE